MWKKKLKLQEYDIIKIIAEKYNISMSDVKLYTNNDSHNQIKVSAEIAVDPLTKLY